MAYYYATDLSQHALAYFSGRALHHARCAGARLNDLDGLERLYRRFYRQRRRAAGLCVECGRTLAGHRCPATED